MEAKNARYEVESSTGLTVEVKETVLPVHPWKPKAMEAKRSTGLTVEAKEIFLRAARGDVDFFKTVAPEILLNARNANSTVLSVAAMSNRLNCCEVIIERCTPLLYYRQEQYNKWSVLHKIVAYQQDNNLDITRFLITADSKPDLELGGGPKIPNYRLLTMQDTRGKTALHLAVEKGKHGATKLLLDADRDFQLLRMVDEGGRTCLHTAAQWGNHVSAELILKTRPDNEFLKMTEIKSKQTALHIAVEKKSVDIVQLLLEADHSNDLFAAVDSHQRTALHYAVEQGTLDMVKLMCKAGLDKELLSMPDSHGNTALHLGVRNCEVEIVKLLIERDMVTVYCVINNDNQTPLSMAMDKAAQDGSGSGSEVICKVLLENDWTKVVDFHGRNVLHVAAYHGHLAVVQHFLAAEFEFLKMTTTTISKQTALHIAVERKKLAVVKLLLEAEHSNDLLTVVDSYGKTPLHLAMDKAAQGGPGSDSKVIYKLLLEKEPHLCTKQMGDMGWTPLHYAISYGLSSAAEDIIRLCPDCIKVEDSHGQTPYMFVKMRMLSAEHEESSISDLKIICMLLEKDPRQCTKVEDKHEQPFIHVAVKLGLKDVVETILKSKETEDNILNIQDKDGNTPLHIAALSENKDMTFCLLYDARVNKVIENNKKEKAIDLINFPYDEAKARVYSLGHQSDLKDQRSFDLLVAALIATVSFTAGITVPGGYVSDGDNKGSAILLKATAFKVFVISNNFALLFSLYTVFLNFSTRRLLKEDDIYYESKLGTFRTRLLLKKKDMIYQLNMATLCTLSAIYAMVVAFITGSYAVLANSDGLAITVCVCSCFFLILASHATWTMVMQHWHSKPMPRVSS